MINAYKKSYNVLIVNLMFHDNLCYSIKDIGIYFNLLLNVFIYLNYTNLVYIISTINFEISGAFNEIGTHINSNFCPPVALQSSF